MTDPLRFGVRDRYAKTNAGGNNLFPLPDIFFQLKRMFSTPVNAEVTAQELDRLLFIAKGLINEDILQRQLMRRAINALYLVR
ncbi:hypothetical protein AM261_23825 [Escherichia coli]|nr:hypothetical protein WG3_01202 [Escherichia coli KTE36]KQI87013.1 hypothetical protein AM261_23825 [Escherichia coli]STE64699.1 Uncharacterised protein [Escherichia coli]